LDLSFTTFNCGIYKIVHNKFSSVNRISAANYSEEAKKRAGTTATVRDSHYLDTSNIFQPYRRWTTCYSLGQNEGPIKCTVCPDLSVL